MSTYVLVAGAFRGTWAWQFVAPRLAAAGHRVIACELTGTGARADERPSGGVHLSTWIDDVARASEPASSVILVGHSMGGVVAHAAAAVLGSSVERVILLDAPLVGHGQRAVDVSSSGPIDESTFPSADTWIPASPVGPVQGFVDPILAEWVNTRLRPTPFQPSLDPVSLEGGVAPIELIFCSLTPAYFPSSLTRSRCDADGRPYRLIESHHDAPLLAPHAVADALLEFGV